MRWDSFIGGSGTGRSFQSDDERTGNFIIETVPANGQTKARRILLSRPGLSTVLTANSGNAATNVIEANGRLFFSDGYYFYEIFANNTFTNYGATGSAGSGSLRTILIASQTQILILRNGAGYIFTLASNTLATITSAGFPSNATQGCYIDGYFIVLQANTQTFWISNVNDGMTWNALNFVSAQGEQSNVISIISDHRYLWLLSETHSEVYYDSGALAIFQRLEGAFMEEGCIGVDARCQFNGSIAWLGQNRDGGLIVWWASGYTPQRISTHAVEAALATYPTCADAIMQTVQDGGHTWLMLHLPSANSGRGACWVYDNASGEWVEWFYLDPTTGVEVAHLGRWHAYCFGRHYVSDWRNATIYVQSTNYATDASAPIRRIRRAPALVAAGRRLYHDELRILAEVGVGLDGTGTSGTDPQIALQWSNDGGKTWSKERTRPLGRIGKYKTMLRWPNLGSSFNRAYQVTCTDNVQLALIAAELDTTPEAGYRG